MGETNMGMRKHTVSLTSDGSQVGTAYTGYLSGYLESIQYIKTDYTDGVDFTITAEATGETLWTESNVNAAVIKHPRAATHSNLGVAALYAGSGTAVNDRIALGRDRVKIVIAQAGVSKVGSFVVTVNDN
jgi:hypothetical protein